MREKVAKMEREGINVQIDNSEVLMNVNVTTFHLWALDKGFVICELSIDVNMGEENHLGSTEDLKNTRRSYAGFKREALDGVKWHIRNKLTKKWC